jgi:hypothetical protein
MSKIQISSETWVALYSELSIYVEKKCFPHRKTHNEQGERLEETEDDFCEIVDDIEGIMSEYLCGESNEILY